MWSRDTGICWQRGRRRYRSVTRRRSAARSSNWRGLKLPLRGAGSAAGNRAGGRAEGQRGVPRRRGRPKRLGLLRGLVQQTRAMHSRLRAEVDLLLEVVETPPIDDPIELKSTNDDPGGNAFVGSERQHILGIEVGRPDEGLEPGRVDQSVSRELMPPRRTASKRSSTPTASTSTTRSAARRPGASSASSASTTRRRLPRRSVAPRRSARAGDRRARQQPVRGALRSPDTDRRTTQAPRARRRGDHVVGDPRTRRPATAGHRLHQ